MPKTKNSVIVDTNLWISFLLTKDFTKLNQLLVEDKLTLLFNKELLDEFIEVAERPKFKKYFSVAALNFLLQQISLQAKFVVTKTEINACRDPKDNFLLALAVDGNATHLITGDKDLLDLEKFGNTAIVTLSDYLHNHSLI